MIDTHTHIYLPEFDNDRDDVVLRAANAGIHSLILPNIDVSTVDALHETTERYRGRCHAAMGLHPTSVEDDYPEQLSRIKSLLESRRYCAIGEIGIDLYWDKSRLQEQKEVFARQTEWAAEWSMPVIIHCREALDEVLEVLERLGKGCVTGVFHSFTGSVAEVEEIRQRAGDFYFGINGIVTFKNAHMEDTLHAIGRERLLLETDAPYLAPVPHRGKRNEPAYTAFTAARVADILGESIEEVDAVTTENARRLFGV